ncbi:EamA family transporter [Streptomyces sp. NPDC059009]|uniref:EamA family transporter n=1 Tax=Streptomyces sp. NPDC059009 TaxID=3346694 RepID=UPI0036C5D5AB
MSGSLLVAVAIALQALSNGLLSDNLSGSESVLLSFTAFSVSALVFGLVARFRRNGERQPLRGERLRLMLVLNAATAVTFLGFYRSLSLIPAPLATAVETGIGPLAIACFRIRQSSGVRRLAELGLGMLALSLALAVAGRMASVGQVESVQILVGGVALAAIAGCSAAGIAVLSYRLGQLKVSPVQVTAHRFHLTYLLALAVLLFGDMPADGPAGTRGAFIVSVAVLGVALPLFVLQIGMQRTPPLVVTLLASAVPGLTYLVSSSAGEQGFDAVTFVLINVSLVVAFLVPVFVGRLAKATTPRSSHTPAQSNKPSPARARSWGTSAEEPGAKGQSLIVEAGGRDGPMPRS